MPPAPPDVTVYIAGSGVLGPGAILSAEATAGQMFQRIGVRLAWASERAANRMPEEVILHVRFVSGPAPSRFPADAMAYACPYAGGTKEITIFWERVRARAPRFVAPVLSHVMAHEIAHVLESIERHAVEGVMKAHWTPADYDSMLCHPLSFTPEDAELIRLGLEHLRGR